VAGTPEARATVHLSPGEKVSWAALEGYAQTRRPTSALDFSRKAADGYFPGHFDGEHMGVGAPPSAKDEVDTAPNNTNVNRSK
jgi:hypothetical protein